MSVVLFLYSEIKWLHPMFCIYIGLFIYYKNYKKVTLVINNTIVKIFFGDIFKMPGKKIIAFNEYFDTIVDEKIIKKIFKWTTNK